MKKVKGDFSSKSRPKQFSLDAFLNKNSNAMGDFGSTNQNDMGFLPDLSKSLESMAQGWGQSLEKQAQSFLDPVKESLDYLDPNISKQIEAELQKTGQGLQTQLKTAAAQEISKAVGTKVRDKGTQDAAVKAVVNQAADYAISVKDSIIDGSVLKKHPILTGVVVGVPALLFLRFMIGKKRTKVVYAAPPAQAKANPRKRKVKRYTRK